MTITPYFGISKAPKGYYFDERRLNQDLIWFVTEPGCRITLDEHAHDVKAGTLLWITAGTKHSVKPSSSNGPTWTNYYFRLTNLTQLPRPTESIIAPDRWDLRPIIDLLLQECQAPTSNHAERINALLLLLSTAPEQPQTHPQTKTGLSPATQRKLITYLQDHASAPITPSDLASVAELSPNYFSRRFHESFGMPPRQWIVTQRIQQASHLLIDSDLPINRIAELYGYDSLYFFSRQFKQVTGLSPRAYRKLHRI